MRALCVGRHSYLADHFATFFRDLGVDTRPAVGFREAVAVASTVRPDVVICDYDLLATLPLHAWESDPLISRVPVVAVSLTRRPNEAHLMDVNGIAGFLYLPTLEPEVAVRVLTAACPRPTVAAPGSLAWPGAVQSPQLR